MKRLLAALTGLALLVGLAGCKPTSNSENPSARKKCSETLRTNCVASSGYIGKGGVRKTLFQGHVIMPVGLSPEQNAPYPNSKEWKDKDGKRAITFYATWWEDGTPDGHQSRYEMEVITHLDADRREHRVNGKEFREVRANVSQGTLAELTVQEPDDHYRTFHGSIFCGVYIWGPQGGAPHVTWGWYVPRNQPGGHDAAQYVDIDDEPICTATLFVP